MPTTSFDDGWSFRREEDSTSVAVHVPHDAMLVEGRSPSSPAGAHNGHFLGGRYVYSKQWTVPDGFADKDLSLRFEGCFGETIVRVNGVVTGESVNGYSEFSVRLSPALRAGVNLIEVLVDNRAQPNSRWYTGSGLYRHVHLHEAQIGAPRFGTDGVGFRTVSIGNDAVVAVDVELAEAASAAAETHVALFDGDVEVARARTSMHHRASLPLTIRAPKVWSAEEPHLYRAVVQIVDDGSVTDEQTIAVGIRTITVDTERGLRVNGAPVLLRGACVHSDNGVLGAATYRAAEFRRARILKENGYNAVRSAHNPMSRDLLDACDELGLYVVDELTDVWTQPKTVHDGSSTFAATWRDDVRSMVAKDRNHASVIMYAIGNENAETATAAGVQIARDLSGLFRALDPTRPTTVAVNFLLNVFASFNVSAFGKKEEPPSASAPQEPQEKKGSKVTSTLANAVTNKIGGLMDLVSRLPLADRASRDAFAEVDVAGYNYAAGRYRSDGKRHPDRVIVGTETMPGDIARNWDLVRTLPHVIGDFMWTGFDYLGEAGIGSWNYGDGATVMNQPYPRLIAGPGAIDITGLPGAPTFLARAAWGELEGPAIAVRPLDHAGEKTARSAWRSTDAVPSWSWAGSEGKPAQIEVYSTEDEIELLLNGRSVGRKRAGSRAGYVTRFSTPYQPGELIAVGYRDKVRTSHSSLRSASTRLRLTLDADRLDLAASGQDLAFVRVAVADEDGVVEMLVTDEVRIEVSGPGTLAGYGNGGPGSERSFLDDTQDTYYGNALAVVRADGAGTIHVTATSARHGRAELDISAEINTRSTTAHVPHL